jgi:hypothetical protein
MKIKTRKEIEFDESYNYAVIPKDSVFNLEYYQGINGEKCAVVDGKPFINSIIYFRPNEYITI